ncbi:MAG: site-specific DNA-methyltransferase [Anaeromicrobium sp.]|uniref:site-specific DNA-methyltransferase n=1 Tax=Anaeromicrobium sp. TaxID=1929132 RepID=UPI0025ED0AD2|nr:site-specific DNA-methyltransferase [Anaeromicrobium sp.]MCT4594357.1 site-specific DNA-methyltransferase [Anaeromicrobium sp.]
MDGKSLDVVKDNIDKLKDIFPEVFCEDKVDFDRLKEVLGKYIEDKNERYSFNWNGKSKAIRLAQEPSIGTLRPVKEESKYWDKTQNFYIEGDNLEVLKLLQKSYYKKVKMIYIDPPYNTGKDFVYPDNFRDNLQNYLELTGQVDEEGRKLGTNSDTSGRYHTDWLNMMYPRLKVAKNLLKEDGIIFISIDEIELSNLVKICDEIFGEYNHVADFVWQKKKGGGNDAKHVAVEHEYIVMYAKNETKLHDLFEPYKPEYLKRYKEEDENGKFFWDTFRRKSGKQYYPITCPDGTILEYDENNNPISWLRSQSRFIDDLSKEEVRFVKIRDKWSIQFKQRLPQGKKPRSIFFEDSIWDSEGTNSDGSNELLELFKSNIFDTPKPVALISKLLGFNIQKNDIVLDFFSGSGTVAHAIQEYNLISKSNVKYILIQLPQIIEPKNLIQKNACEYLDSCNKPHLITEIGKERIRKAGEKILEENKDKEGIENLDIGFKVFRLDTSNIKTWDVNFDSLETGIEKMVNNIKSDRRQEDVLYEILLKYGLDLTLPVEEMKLADKTVYSFGYGALVICLDNDITLEVVEEIGKFKEDCDTEIMRVVFKDTGFKNDSVKTNAMQILKRYGIEDVKSI